jgi:hypothetical protein
MPLFRRAPKPDPRDAVYVHLCRDGAIFIVRGATGEQLWTDREGMKQEIEAVLDRPSPALLYSRDDPDRDPSPELEETFKLMLDATQKKLPLQLLTEAHPQAVLPPDERRSILGGV